MINKFSIKNKKISQNNKPFIVAELSANHGNSLSTALKTIDEAKKNGADAIKIQTYTADSMTLNSKKKFLKLKVDYGKATICIIYIKEHQHHTNGIKKFLNIQKKRNLFVFLHLLMKKQLICLRN